MWTVSGISSRMLGRSSSTSAASYAQSYVSMKLPELKDQGVCWNDDVKIEPEGGGVVIDCAGLVGAMRSITELQMSTSKSLMTLLQVR